MAYVLGPKGLQVKGLREKRFAQKGGKKPSTSDLRKQIAKVKSMSKKQTGRRGR